MQKKLSLKKISFVNNFKEKQNLFPFYRNNTLTKKNNCKLKLNADDENEITGLVSVDRFSSDKSIIVWWQRRVDSQYTVQKIGVSLVNLSNCETRHIHLPVDVEKRPLLSNVVVYTHGFDLVVTNEDICNSSSSTTCRISYDSFGRRVVDDDNNATPPTPFSMNFDTVNVLPVDPNSAKDGFYVQGTDVVSWKFRSMRVTADGQVSHLMSAEGVSDPRRLLRATSNSNRLYGICIIGVNKLHCAQFDSESRVRIDAKVNVTKGSSVPQWLGLYNLAVGEALLVYGSCRNDRCRGFKVVVIKEGGRELRSIDVPNLNLRCHDKFTIDIAVDDNQNVVCFYFACQHKSKELEEGAKGSVKFQSRCMSKGQFFL